LDRENIYSFEDLDVYKLAREFSHEISQLIKKLPNVEDYNLKWVCTLLNRPQDVECGHGRAKAPRFGH
jgi:hypothetical protein